jgi:signal transduction histidine kinase
MNPWRERWIPVGVGLSGLALVALLAWRDASSVLAGQDLAIAQVSGARAESARREIADWTLGLQDSLWRTLEGATDSALGELASTHPLVTASFRTVRNQVVFPRTGPDASQEEEAFLSRTARLWTGKAAIASGRSRGGEGSAATDQGLEWIPWHWEDGLHILVRRVLDDTSAVGLELDRTALLARLVGEVNPRDMAGGSLDLRDGSGRLLHRWGSYRPDSVLERAPLARTGLAEPFETWSLEVRGPEAAWSQAARANSLRNLAFRWGMAAIVWLVAVFLVAREWTRTLREARLKTGFVQQVSHELRTPLTNIRLHAELARDGTLEDDTARHLDVVGQETERLSRLVANILTFARSEKEPVRVHPRNHPLAALMDSALAPFAASFAREGVALERRMPTGEHSLLVDPDAGVQILQNLVGNAAKYAARGRWIGVDVAECSNRWEIRVRDHGPGIPAKNREDIFRPFWRASRKVDDGVAGTGIGLGIARELARAHGGELSLETGSPGTCTFLWILPKSTTSPSPSRGPR